MKKIIRSTQLLAVIGIFLCSFSKPGGEGFQISLNNKIILQQYGNDLNDIKPLPLENVSAKDRLTVKYYHCGKEGRNRTITLMDGNNNILKTFRYPDTGPGVTAMEIPLKDVMHLKRTMAMKIFYSSSELPRGRVLASISTSSGFAAR